MEVIYIKEFVLHKIRQQTDVDVECEKVHHQY